MLKINSNNLMQHINHFTILTVLAPRSAVVVNSYAYWHILLELTST